MNIKKVTILVLTVLLSANIYCQKNALYLLVQPTDMGYGLRYDRQIKNLGIYASLSKGEYDLYNEYYIEDHIKISLGGLAFGNDSPTFFSYGFNYHHYGDSFIGADAGNNTLTPVSVELGAGTAFNHLKVAFRMDIIKWESSIDIGVRF